MGTPKGDKGYDRKKERDEVEHEIEISGREDKDSRGDKDNDED